MQFSGKLRRSKRERIVVEKGWKKNTENADIVARGTVKSNPFESL